MIYPISNKYKSISTLFVFKLGLVKKRVKIHSVACCCKKKTVYIAFFKQPKKYYKV